MTSRVRLSAALGEPLADDSVRSIVVSPAAALGERTGVQAAGPQIQPDATEAAAAGAHLAATALAAELRRITDQWHLDRHGGNLWGDL